MWNEEHGLGAGRCVGQNALRETPNFGGGGLYPFEGVRPAQKLRVVEWRAGGGSNDGVERALDCGQRQVGGRGGVIDYATGVGGTRPSAMGVDGRTGGIGNVGDRKTGLVCWEGRGIRNFGSEWGDDRDEGIRNLGRRRGCFGRIGMRNQRGRGILLGEFLATSAPLARIPGCGDVRFQHWRCHPRKCWRGNGDWCEANSGAIGGGWEGCTGSR